MENSITDCVGFSLWFSRGTLILGELWASGEPNDWDHYDGAGGEDCAEFYSGILNDNSCLQTKNFICSYVIQKWLVANNCWKE